MSISSNVSITTLSSVSPTTLCAGYDNSKLSYYYRNYSHYYYYSRNCARSIGDNNRYV